MKERLLRIPHPKRFINIFKRSKATERPYRALMALWGRNPIWTDLEIKKLAEEGFKNCMTVFACVSLLSKGAAGIPWQLFKKPISKDSKKEEIFQHDLLDRIHRPNEHCGQAAFIENLAAFYYIAGNSYMLQVGPEGERAAPRELHYLYPHLMKIKPGTRAEPVAYYEYSANPAKPDPYTTDDVLHIKAFHPLNSYYGLSPLEAAARGIDIANMTMSWNMKLLQNDMRPAGMFKIEGNLDKEQRDDFKADLKENYQSYENTAMPLILEGGQDWIQTALSPKDLDWITGEKMTIRKICSVLNVASELIGDSENKTYSNVKEARKALYTEAILPFMDFLRDEFNNWLVPKWNDERLYLDYNRGDIEALKEEAAAVFTRMASAHWLTINEKRVASGFDENPAPEADKIYLPMMLVPIDGGSAAAAQPGNGGAKANKKASFWQRKENKQRLWAHFVKRVEAKERTLWDPAQRYLVAQARRVKAGMAQFKTIGEVDVNKILNDKEEAAKYQKIFEGQYREHFLLAGQAGMEAAEGKLLDLSKELKQEEGFHFTDDLLKQMEWLIMNSGAKISEATLKKIAQHVIKGQIEGLTVEATTQVIWEKLTSLAITRSRTISRTEMAKLENFGQMEGYKQTEFVELKGWLSAMVPDTRLAHTLADAEYADNPIALDAAFIVDGEALQYPGDPNGSPGNVINCLCATYPEVREI